MKVPTIKKCFHIKDVEDPSWNFFVTAEAKNLIDLNRILLCVKVGVYTEDGKTCAKMNEHPIGFSTNTLQTLSWYADFYLNGKLISNSNNCYLHAAFIETERTTDTEGKKPGQSVRVMISCQKQKSKSKPSKNFRPTLTAEKNVQQSSKVHYMLIFLTAKIFWYL